MNRKAVIIAIILVIAAGLAYWFFNQAESGADVEYQNEKYGFRLSMNQEFEEQVEINEADHTVYFVSREIQSEQPDMIFGVIGRIEIYDKNEFSRENMMESGEAYSLKYLGENNRYYFGVAHATDVQIPPGDESLNAKFRALEANFDEMIKTFKTMEVKMPETPEAKTDTGRYVGLADNNFFEVQISGVPEEQAYKVFMISAEVRSKFEALDLQGDEMIKLKYIENENGQNVVEDIEKI